MSIYDEFDKNLYKLGQEINVQEADQLQSGSFVNSLSVSNGFLKSGSFVDGSAGWKISANGDAQFNNLTLTGGSLKSGKTSFTDSTNAGYFISPLGVYFGSASDATKLKYTVADGTLDLIGTISSRSTATLASAIDSSGDLITSKLNTSTKRILSDFNFGTTDYAGAVKAGDIAWNTSTGAITGGSGVVVYRNGIVGANSGVTTFSIDANTGNATFAGTLSGASGTFGTITAGTLDGTNVFANDFRWKKNTILYNLSNVNVTNGGWTNSISTNGILTGFGSNQMSLSLASAASEDSNTKTTGYGIVLGGTDTQAVLWNFNPSIEFWAKVDITGTNPLIKVRMGNTPGNTESYVGFNFSNPSGTVRPTAYGYNPGGPDISTTSVITSVDASQWHKYRIQVTKTATATYDIVWYIDDVSKHTETFTHEWTTTTTSFSVDVANNIADITKTAAIIIAHAKFQQNYS